MHILRQSELDGMPCPDTLIHGDCLESMKHIADGSVSAIICDLPYGTTACKWDTVIPFAPLWEAYKRIIKPGGAIVLFGSEPFSSHLRLSNLAGYKYDWYWKKQKATGHLNCKKQPLRTIETVSVFCLGQSCYFPQMIKGNLHTRGPWSVTKNSTTVYGSFNESQSRCYESDEYYPNNTLDNFPMVPSSEQLHSTQKPVTLLEYLVRTYTNPGDLVLDNCMGSATLPVACLNTGRHFIGIEKDDAYFDTAVTRVRTREIELASTLGL